MSDLVKIDDSKLEFFTDRAKEEFRTQAEKLVQELLDETYLVETARREANAKQEVTQTDVMNGARQSMRYTLSKKKWWYKASQVLAPLLSIILGLVFDPKDSTSMIVSMFLFGMIVFLTVLVILKND